MEIPIFFSIFVSANKLQWQTIKIVYKMEKQTKTFGRSELAQQYFPGLTSMSAWRKFKEWLDYNPRLRHLLSLTRRTFTPAEVEQIYSELGAPWISATCKDLRKSYFSLRAIYHLDKWFLFLVYLYRIALSTFQQFNNWWNTKSNNYSHYYINIIIYYNI